MDGRDFYDKALDPDTTPQIPVQDHDLIWLMSTMRGRRVMQRFLAATGQTDSSFAGEMSQTTAFNEGRRWAGLVFVKEIRRLCPEAELEMHREAQKNT